LAGRFFFAFKEHFWNFAAVQLQKMRTAGIEPARTKRLAFQAINLNHYTTIADRKGRRKKYISNASLQNSCISQSAVVLQMRLSRPVKSFSQIV
jgi:hypothetical protein